MAIRTVSVDERRALMVRRHHLAGDADGPDDVTRALVALHATDPASVFLSVIARSAASTLEDVAVSMYETRRLVRWMAMRRTLFVFNRDDVPMIQAAVSTPLAQTLRRRLISQLEKNGSEPPIEGDLDGWLNCAERDTVIALHHRGAASGAELSADVPSLRTSITPRAPSDRPQNVTTSLLTIMSADGLLVRSIPTGPWTSRHHRWQSVDEWWPDGLPVLDPVHAQTELVRRWLERFGPATIADLEWWTGWNKKNVREALGRLPIEFVDLHGVPGIVLADESARDTLGADAPVATLLPALDPTPMGWKQRDWMFAIDQRLVFDSHGNVGPTVWWDGEIVGSWATSRAGEVRAQMDCDRGSIATQAVERAAARLTLTLRGQPVIPAIRTPLEASLWAKSE